MENDEVLCNRAASSLPSLKELEQFQEQKLTTAKKRSMREVAVNAVKPPWDDRMGADLVHLGHRMSASDPL